MGKDGIVGYVLLVIWVCNMIVRQEVAVKVVI